MERAEILNKLAVGSAATVPQEPAAPAALAALATLAAELDLPLADLYVITGRPVPADLLPPERDVKAMEHFAYLASHCDHAQLAALEAFVRALPRTDAPGPFVQPASPHRRPAETGWAAVLNGLLRNRGFGVRELPFTGLSRPTLHQMVSRWEADRHRQFRLRCLAGPLGWTLPDLFALVGEPYSEELRPVVHCRHLGRVFTAAVPLTTAQLLQASEQVHRLRGGRNTGAWQPVSEGFVGQCPDYPEPPAPAGPTQFG
ncbi:hypothetical protein ACFVXG_17320 [Kitasatospora sp. NPDC058162]|uniref:hypothetical protein n=1 Tax=Kitasatospora sp. NPDC058162 TaxID=3346362 RepID=UPI0036D9ACA4